MFPFIAIENFYIIAYLSKKSNKLEYFVTAFLLFQNLNTNFAQFLI
jgi:hypothetical protein